jgi:hypothetical protein
LGIDADRICAGNLTPSGAREIAQQAPDRPPPSCRFMSNHRDLSGLCDHPGNMIR